jgi:tetratricopeptide (TPR) repeat protein
LYLSLDENGVNDHRIDLILEKLERTAMKGKVTRKALDRYRWPLGAGLLLLLGAWLAGIAPRHRSKLPPPLPRQLPPPLPRAALSLLMLGGFLLLAPATPAAAPQVKDPKDLPEGNPWTFYQDGKFDAALHNFQKKLGMDQSGGGHGGGDSALEFGRGAAAYKNKDYDTAVDAFGSAVLADGVPLRAQAHYNLANAIYQRTATLAKEAKPKTLAKLSFIDGLIRQLENSLENYQQALALQPDEADFKANHDTTDALIQKLRTLRKQMADQQGEGEGKDKKKGKKKGKKGEGQSPGQGKGEGEEDEGGNGPNGEEEGEGEGKQPKDAGPGEKEGDEAKAAREKSNEKKDGKIGDQNQPGKEPGEESGGEKDKGSEKGQGEEPDEQTDADNEVNPETGFSTAEAKRQLERLSDEDMKVRPRVDQVPESRPLKDW